MNYKRQKTGGLKMLKESQNEQNFLLLLVVLLVFLKQMCPHIIGFHLICESIILPRTIAWKIAKLFLLFKDVFKQNFLTSIRSNFSFWVHFIYSCKGAPWAGGHIFSYFLLLHWTICFVFRELEEWKAQIHHTVFFCDSNMVWKDIQRDITKHVLHDQNPHI